MRNSAIRLGVGRGWPGTLLVTILVLGNGLAAGTAAADDESSSPKSIFDQKISVALGGFYSLVDATISLNPSRGGSGQDINLQDDLGLGETSLSAWLGMSWRFKPRHQIQAEWFELDRSGTTSAAREFTIGDTTVFAGAGVSSKIDLNIARITYGYSILRDEAFDLSFLAGAHIATTKLTVTAAGSIAVDGVPIVGGVSTESSSTFTFPLPHLGGQFSYKFAPRWAAQFTLLAFALEVNAYSGSLVEANATVAYQLSEHFGIGTGLKYFNLNLQAQKSRGGAEFNYQFYGPTIFGYATF